MTAFIVVDTKIHDAEAYERYKLLAKPIVEKHGGAYRVRGGEMTVIDQALWTPTRLVIVEFPSRAAAEAFVNDPEYAPAMAIRQAAADSTLAIIDGF